MLKHQYKNLSIELPSDWTYEHEQGDIEAGFNPNSSSTFRMHIITATFPADKTKEKLIVAVTQGKSYETTHQNYIFLRSLVEEAIEQNQNITIIQWQLIDISEKETIVGVFTYTVLTSEKDSEREQQMIALLENSIKNAIFK